jgi:hypothetical protein
MSKVSHVESNVAALATAPPPPLLAELARAAAPMKNRAWPSGLPENEHFTWPPQG